LLGMFTGFINTGVALTLVASAWGILMLFNLITLPVEFDASARARLVLRQTPSQPDLPISYNIAPSQEVLAIRFNTETKQRSLDRLRWGLVPYWAKDEKIGFKTINARAETVDTAHSFRSAFKKEAMPDSRRRFL
jgi:putative SOS response-associated peptidase YedK